ncbi:MAG TPA: prephenate dehydrogenase/arogenate dehydrogenase family protein, partial [Hyphomicrobiales bacterium]|nr:prephenate dehydrogenase/arogenate dehydrogenase family protein [Hyphomicrobiales bacterium]
MRKPIFDRVTIIGLGLIGSSLCHVIRREGLAKTIVGSAKSEATLKTAERLNLCDALYADPAEAAADADLIILCSPIGTYGPLAEKIAPV